jgi:hypothetical protein
MHGTTNTQTQSTSKSNTRTELTRSSRVPSKQRQVSKYSHKIHLIQVGLDRWKPACPTRFRLVEGMRQSTARLNRKLKAQVTPLAKTIQCRSRINNTRWMRLSAITNAINEFLPVCFPFVISQWPILYECMDGGIQQTRPKWFSFNSSS